MMARTHMVASAAVFSSGSFVLTGDPQWSYLPAVLFGSLLPDMDHPNSKIGRRMVRTIILAPIPYMLYYLLGHRTITHSLIAITFWIALVASLFYIQIEAVYVVAIMCIGIGYILHLTQDYFADRGIPLFYPFSHRRYMAAATVHTGGVAEWGLIAASIAALANVTWMVA